MGSGDVSGGGVAPAGGLGGWRRRPALQPRDAHVSFLRREYDAMAATVASGARSRAPGLGAAASVLSSS